VSAAAILGKILQRSRHRPQGMLIPDQHPVGWSGLRCPSRPPPRGDVAAQVLATSAEKYDGTTNPSEFLQVYVTAITAVGGDTAVLATYFHVALSRPARTWLMNQAPGSICSWEELCARFVANFASAYQRHGVEAHLHAVRQEPGETLRAFISRFTRVHGTIP
jgi:hypothetical protein